MFIKFQEDMPSGADITVVECDEYRLYSNKIGVKSITLSTKGNDVHTHSALEGGGIRWAPKCGVTIYIMNDAGKTIDTIKFGYERVLGDAITSDGKILTKDRDPQQAKKDWLENRRKDSPSHEIGVGRGKNNY